MFFDLSDNFALYHGLLNDRPDMLPLAVSQISESDVANSTILVSMCRFQCID
jgi:hypothetical protein